MSIKVDECEPLVGGLSAEHTLKTVKMASARYYDNIHTTGNAHGTGLHAFTLELNLSNSWTPS